MAKKRTSSSRTTKGTAKAAAPEKVSEAMTSTTKVAEAIADELITVRKKLKELEKEHLNHFESVHKVDVESDFRWRKAMIDYNVDFHSASNNEEEGAIVREAQRNYLNEQFDLREENRAKKKELHDAYLEELKKNWAILQKSDVDLSQIGEIGFFFCHLASEALQLKRESNM